MFLYLVYLLHCFNLRLYFAMLRLFPGILTDKPQLSEPVNVVHEAIN